MKAQFPTNKHMFHSGRKGTKTLLCNTKIKHRNLTKNVGVGGNMLAHRWRSAWLMEPQDARRTGARRDIGKSL